MTGTRRPWGAWPEGWSAHGSNAMHCSLQTRRMLTPSCSPAPAAGVPDGCICSDDLMAAAAQRSEPVDMSEDQTPARPDPSSTPARVVVAGGGVAAVETLLALRDLAGERVSTTVVAPQPTFESSAMSVARVFSRGHLRQVELAEIADEVVCDSVAEVDPAARRIRCASGDELGYDHLVLAVGAIARPAWRHGITFGEDPAEEALHGLLEEVERGYVGQVAFVVPGCGAVWPLPLYELAVMAARQAWSMGMDQVRFALITPEERPLAVFGRAPSQAVAELLDGCGIEFIGSTYASVSRGCVELDPSGRRLDRVRVVSSAGAGRSGPAGRARGSGRLHPRRPAWSGARPRRRLCSR